MPKGLFTLYLLKTRGAIRKIFRGLNRPKNLVMFVVGIIVFGGWMFGAVVGSLDRSRSDTFDLWLYGPLAMLGLFLLTATGAARNPGLYFLPAEIEHLFPAPITRRALLTYKLLSEATLIVPFSVFAALFLRRFTASFVSALIGMYVLMMFIQFGQRSVSLFMASVSERLRGRVWLIALAVPLLLASAVFARSGSLEFSIEALNSLAGSPIFRAVVFPFSIATQIMVSRSAPELLEWTAAGTVCVGLAFWFVLRLDVDYREASIASSRRIQDRLDRFRRTNSLTALSAKSGSAHRSIPMFPRWGGLGPIVWRQFVGFTRNWGILLLPILIVGGVAAIAVATPQRADGRSVLEILPMVALMMNFFAVQTLRFDFRGDLAQMETLRLLPISAFRLAIGQILVPTLLLSTLQSALCVILAIVQPQAWAWLVGGAVLIPLFNGLLFAMENLAFLVYPLRSTGQPGIDFQNIGRNTLVMMGKMFTLLVICGMAVAAGAAGHFATGGFVPAVILPTALVLAGSVWLVVLLASLAFRKFDLSADI